MQSYTHPLRVAAFALVYRNEGSDSPQSIRSIGAFTVKLGRGNDVEFCRYHWTYAKGDQFGPLSDMRSLIDARTDCLCSVTKPLRSDPAVFGEAYIDETERHAFPIIYGRGYRRAHFIRASDGAIRTMAFSHGIDLAMPDAEEVLRASQAADRAQAIWLTWTELFLHDDPDRAGLLAGYRAYRKLDELRPIPF